MITLKRRFLLAAICFTILILCLPLRVKASGWTWVGSGTKMQYMNSKNNSVVKSKFKTINGRTYYFDKDGYVHTGWLYLKNDTYFFRSNGTMVKSSWVGKYYFLKSGKMAKNKWIGGKKTGKYVGSNGQLIENYKAKAKFVTNAKGTRYRNYDGSYVKKQWLCIKSRWYYFYSTGYVAKKRKIGKYYVNSKGQMVTNTWVKIGRYKYYYGSDGKMIKKIKI